MRLGVSSNIADEVFAADVYTDSSAPQVIKTLRFLHSHGIWFTESLALVILPQILFISFLYYLIFIFFVLK